MQRERWWLTLDQGGHASRAIVFAETGQLIAQSFAPIHTHNNGLHVEHDASTLLHSLQQCLGDIAQQLGADLRHIVAAGMATQRSSIVCWNRYTGVALSPVLSWQDRRQSEWLLQFESQREQIQASTGLVLSPHYGASKLRWCLDHLDAVRTAQADHTLAMGPLSSYLLHGLLTEHPCVVDPANASRTLLWSPATRNWDDRLLTLFGIARSALPTCVPTQHDYGHLLLAQQRIPLRICTGDQAAVPFANGPLDTQCVYINAGTGAFALAPASTDIPNAAPLLRSVLWSDDAAQVHALEGTVNGAGSALSWYAHEFGTDVDAVTTTLNRCVIGTGPLPLFINGVGGIGSPFWLPAIESRFVRTATAQPSATDDIAAIVESIAFLLTANVALMQTHLPGLQRMLIGGGLAQCDYLCECLADLTGLAVQRLAERELTAKGVAFLCAGQPQNWQHESVIPLAQTTHNQFSPQHNPTLKTRQQAWLAVLSSAATTPRVGH